MNSCCLALRSSCSVHPGEDEVNPTRHTDEHLSSRFSDYPAIAHINVLIIVMLPGTSEVADSFDHLAHQSLNTVYPGASVPLLGNRQMLKNVLDRTLSKAQSAL